MISALLEVLCSWLLLVLLLVLLPGVEGGVRVIYDAETSPSLEHEHVTLVLVTDDIHQNIALIYRNAEMLQKC